MIAVQMNPPSSPVGEAVSTRGNGIVEVPFTSPLAPSDMSILETVVAGALDMSITPATAMAPDGRAVKVWPRAVRSRKIV